VGTIDHDWNANQSDATLDGQVDKAFTHEGLGLSLLSSRVFRSTWFEGLEHWPDCGEIKKSFLL
jgi:hypothetical protein